ncbi:ANTAR domain-containing response regulator [Sinimarinibacterium thermocellulolyticum]|uniref:ANTAR domain-containing protein n=1 Tax=Sinimarinibacterium thermocellulolyticum TaxID=3170016 RepID=A0ABV2AEH0_9GAMM
MTPEPVKPRKPAKPRTRVMLVDDDRGRLVRVQQALADAGHEVVACVGAREDLLLAIVLHAVDVVLIDTEAPSRDTLESLSRVSREQPRPIVLFCDDGDTDTIRRAIRAGVSAYVVDGLVESRLKSLIEVAIAQFEAHQQLRREVDEARARLNDRDDIDRAKAVLMRRAHLSEDQAYERLRRMAMNRKLRLADVARALLTVNAEGV